MWIFYCLESEENEREWKTKRKLSLRTHKFLSLQFGRKSWQRKVLSQHFYHISLPTYSHYIHTYPPNDFCPQILSLFFWPLLNSHLPSQHTRSRFSSPFFFFFSNVIYCFLWSLYSSSIYCFLLIFWFCMTFIFFFIRLSTMSSLVSV